MATLEPKEGLASEGAYQKVREAVLLGDLEPGRIVTQGELVDLLEVTRAPLREALRRLQNEGLITAEPNRRVRIAPLTIEDLEQLYVMRLSLEGGAVRLTVPELTADAFGEAEGLMATMDHFARRDDWPRLRAPHRAFHMMMVSGAGDQATELMGQLFDRTERYRHAYWGSVPSYWEKGRREHRAILDAAQAGDAHGTAQAIARHYLTTGRAVVSELAPGHDWEPLRRAVEYCAGGSLDDDAEAPADDQAPAPTSQR